MADDEIDRDFWDLVEQVDRDVGDARPVGFVKSPPDGARRLVTVMGLTGTIAVVPAETTHWTEGFVLTRCFIQRWMVSWLTVPTSPDELVRMDGTLERGIRTSAVPMVHVELVFELCLEDISQPIHMTQVGYLLWDFVLTHAHSIEFTPCKTLSRPDRLEKGRYMAKTTVDSMHPWLTAAVMGADLAPSVDQTCWRPNEDLPRDLVA
jgi:hypothetical protein